MEELIGKTLGQYRIVAKIGSGGMASVFKAYQFSLDRFVAVKVLPPSFASKNPVFVQRFEREAKAIARLHHPNIVPVYDFGIEQDYSFIVMRYVEGALTLGQLIPHALQTERVIDLVSQVANALTYAHQHGIIHRDVKPSNVLLDGEWALLSDFGLVKVQETLTRLTDTGRSIGTPAYMSPEQARAETVDHRSDIYSLGVILYEMLTHKIPHDAPTPLGIMLKRTTEPPPSPRTINPEISESVERVILRSLAVNRAARYDSAVDYSTALKRAFADPSYREPNGAESVRNTVDLTTKDVSTPATKKEVSKKRFPNRLIDPFWLTLAGLAIIAMVSGLWGARVFSSEGTRVTPSLPTSAAAVSSTSTEAPPVPPTSTPTAIAITPTDTRQPSPSPTSGATDTPVLPTSPPLIVVVTATATNISASTPTPSPSLPIFTPTPLASPTPNVPSGTFLLLEPLSLEKPSYGPTNFEWEWNGALPPDFGFEVRVWREGESPAGVHDAVLDNEQGRVKEIGNNRYRLNVDIREAAGVRGRTGEYLWTVAVVQIKPSYVDFGLQAPPARLRFEAGGGGGGGDGSGGGSDGGGIF